MWEQSGNKTCQTPSKTGYHDIGKDKTNQPLSFSKLDLQAGGREFESPHVHQLIPVRPGDMGDTMYRTHG
jgi:hypothetical protein